MLINDENKAELIEKYLKGLMSDEDRVRFENILKSDSDLAEEVALFKEMNSHFDESDWVTLSTKTDTSELEGYFRSEEALGIKNKLKSIGNSYTQNQGKEHSKKRSPMLMVAAIVGLFICLGGYFFMGSNGSIEYNDYYDSRDLPSLMSRGLGDELIESTVVAFQEKNYKKSLEFYKKYLENTETLNESIYIYGGMAYLETKAYDKAIEAFDKMSNSDSIDSSKGLWFKALVYLKMDNKVALKEVLNVIVNDEDNFNYKKAVALLEELD